MTTEAETTLLQALPGGLFIDGRWRAAGDGRQLAVHDPATGRVVKLVADAGPADARAAVDAESLDVALLDMTLPDGMATDIIEGWQSRMRQGLKVVVFSSYDPEEVAPALQGLGVYQYVNKERGMKPLIQAVQAAVHSMASAEKNVETSPDRPNIQAEGVCHQQN